MPHLHRAFPAGTNRRTVDRKIGDLHGLRNRAAHWEPLLAAPLTRRMGDPVRVAGLLSPELAAFVQHHSEVAVLLAKRP
ncbi:hypothetical protein ACFRPV_36230 [Kitasatospora sp. NPDC056808]